MKCEKCERDHDGSYGSGRFCSRACANSRVWSQKDKQKKSETVKKKFAQEKWGYHSITSEHRKAIGFSVRKKAIKDLLEAEFNTLSDYQQRKILLLENDYRCQKCNVGEWEGEQLPLEIHHINGDRKDKRRENVELLCPNCHSITPNWKTKTHYTREKLAKRQEDNIRAYQQLMREMLILV